MRSFLIWTVLFRPPSILTLTIIRIKVNWELSLYAFNTEHCISHFENPKYKIMTYENIRTCLMGQSCNILISFINTEAKYSIWLPYPGDTCTIFHMGKVKKYYKVNYVIIGLWYVHVLDPGRIIIYQLQYDRSGYLCSKQNSHLKIVLEIDFFDVWSLLSLWIIRIQFRYFLQQYSLKYLFDHLEYYSCLK